MLFRKKHPRSCAYCTYGAQIDGDQILCIKKGAVSGQKACRKFAYDPCKRVPLRPKVLDFVKYNDEDFAL